MSLIGSDKSCKPAYGGCTCSCHRSPDVYHCVPCCWPGKRDIFDISSLVLQDDLDKKKVDEIMKLVAEYVAVREWAMKALGRTGVPEVSQKYDAVKTAILQALQTRGIKAF